MKGGLVSESQYLCSGQSINLRVTAEWWALLTLPPKFPLLCPEFMSGTKPTFFLSCDENIRCVVR